MGVEKQNNELGGLALFLALLMLLITVGFQQQPTSSPTPSSTAPTPAPTPPPKPAEFVTSNLSITPNKVVSGASVTIEVTVINIGELSGTHEVNLKIEDAIEDTEKVTLDGGASQVVTFTVAKSTAKTYSIGISGQSGTFTVQPPPVLLPPLDAFMKGIHFNDWRSFDAPKYGLYGLGTDQSLKDLAATGANWISVIVRAGQETISSTTIFRDSPATATDSELLQVIELAHNLGIRVALLPAVVPSEDPDHSWIDIGNAFTRERQWKEWFTSYREFINYYASFAQKSGVDLFFVGSELPGVTHREKDWRRVIKGVRERYNGLISYDSVIWGYPKGECERIKWWDAVDYVATDVWFKLTDKNDPTIEELREAWIKKDYLAKLENLAGLFEKPFIISEIGYDSLDGANRWPALAWLKKGPEDLQEQADCYQVALETLWGKPWLKGIFWWQWSAKGYAWGGSPQGKPAEEVLKKFYLSQ